ncbi:MAG: GAF domain-containing protein [Candidatus Eisenbacteria bacterium]|nr:GAF domain-containing protein [Candidatus Eisenbacteria bacterium]
MSDLAASIASIENEPDTGTPGRWWLTAVSGLAVVILATSTMEWLDWGAVGIMSALGIGTGVFAFPVGRRIYVSFGTAVLLASLGLFGLNVAVWVAIATSLVLEGIFFHRGWRVTARDTGMEVLALGAAAIVYSLLGGRTPPQGMQLIDVGRFAVTFFSFSAVASLFTRATDESDANPLLRYVRWMAGRGVVIELAMFPLALLMIASYGPDDQATFPLLAVVLMVSSAAGRTLWDAGRSLVGRLDELKLLNATGRGLSSAVHRDDIVLSLRDHICPLVDIGCLAVTFRHEGERQSLAVLDGESRVFSVMERGPGTTLIDGVLESGETRVAEDLARDGSPPLPDGLLKELERRGLAARGCISLPLSVAGTDSAALTIVATRPKTFRESDTELYGTIGSQVARALEKAELYEQLETSNEQIAGWNRELEKRVRQRTEELEEARAQLEELNAELEDRVRERTGELHSMQEKIIESGKLAAVGELAAGVAHELNSPLGGILGYAQYDLEKLKSAGESLDRDGLERLTEHMTYIERETQRCRGIVEGLVRFAETSGRSMRVVGLNGVIRTAIDFTASQLAMRGIHLETSLDDELPKISADTVELQQAFANIIMNARDAMPDGGRLTVRTGRALLDDGANGVSVSFSDTGMGISEENLSRVFEPFYSTRSPGSGTGLGLSVSYGIIREHGGSISVESDIGIGTTFTIRLPAAVRSRPTGETTKADATTGTEVVQ